MFSGYPVGPKLRLGLPAYFVSNVRHMQWPISQIYNEGSIFIKVRAFFFFFFFFISNTPFFSAITVFMIFP